MTRIRVLIVVAAVALGAFSLSAYSNNDDHLFRFSHRLHLGDVGAECADCHPKAASATSAETRLLPSIDACYNCHEKDEKPVGLYGSYVPPPRELIFSHAQHLSGLKLECRNCHAAVLTAETSPSKGIPPMDGCVDCHKKSGVRSNCESCHTHVELLIPEDHGADWILDHVEIARQDESSCTTCHNQTYCQECHDGAALGLSIRGEQGAPVDRIGRMAPTSQGKDLLILQRQHDLNYRFTHATEARTRVSDCATCHETNTFCASCHRPENDEARYLPYWHQLSSFNDPSSSQNHGEMARTDIEACAACHDRAAAEPVCLQCHRPGGSGGSPHPAGFMENIEGSWHDNDDAVCFVCHDPGTRTPGVGFCGKCHGEEQ